MNLNRCNGLKLVAALPLGLIIVCLQLVPAYGQSESQLENMKQVFGPDIWNESGIRLGRLELDWQLKQREALVERLEDNRLTLEKELREHRVEKEALNSRKPADYRLATEQVRSELTGRCLEKLLEARLEIAANQALLTELEKHTEEQESAKNPISEVTKAKLQNLALQHELIVRDLERVKQLHAQGALPASSATEIEIQKSKVEGEIKVLEAEAKAVAQLREINSSKQFVDLDLETKRLSAFAKVAASELEKLGEAEKIERQISEGQVRLDAMLIRQKAIATRLASLYIEVEELKSLRSLIDEAIEQQQASKAQEPKHEGANETDSRK